MRWISESQYRRWLHRALAALDRKLIVFNIDYMGLGNRLKLLAVYDVNWGLDDVTMFWNRHGWVNCSMFEILRIEGVRNFREVPISEKNWMVPVITHPSKEYFWPRGYWRFDVGGDLPANYNIERRGLVFPSIDFLYHATPQPYLDRYKAFFSRLHPSEAVARRVSEVDVTPDDVCVQVRIAVDENDRANVPHIDSYITHMKSFPPQTRFFISTLHGSLSDIFRRTFGDRILELPNKQYRSMIDATADMFLLGKGGRYLVSGGSTFGEVAWWIGGGQQRVVQIAPEVFA